MNLIEIKIKNWDKYNPRKDYKKPWWFAMSNRFLEDAEFFHFKPEEKLAWIYILSQASIKRCARVIIVPEHFERSTNMKKSFLISAISKLTRLGCTDSVQNPYEICTESVRDPVATEQNSTEQNTIGAQPSGFAEIYKMFPRKEGKARGMSIFKRDIKNSYDEGLLRSAIEKYTDHCRRSRVEPKFVKQFGTFMSDWRSWLDADAGQVVLRPPIAPRVEKAVISPGAWQNGKAEVLNGKSALELMNEIKRRGNNEHEENKTAQKNDRISSE